MNLRTKQLFLFLLLSYTYYLPAQWMQWDCRSNYSLPEFEHFAQDMKKRGYSPVNLSVATDLNTTRVSSIWQKSNADDWICLLGIDQDFFFDTTKTLKNIGLYPIDIAIWQESDSKIKIAGIWKKSNHDGFVEFGIKENEFKQKIIDYNNKGYSPKDVNGYIKNDSIFYVVIFDRQPKGALSLAFGNSPAEFQQEFEKRSSLGYCPVDINYFNKTENIKCNSIWAKRDILWEHQKGYTINELQDYLNQKTDEGYIPTDIDQYYQNGEFLFATTLTKSTKPRIVAVPSHPQNVLLSSSLKQLLPIAPIEQPVKFWSWLAVGEMVFKYYNLPKPNPKESFQCQILQSVFQNNPCYTNCLNNKCINNNGLNSNIILVLKDYPWMMSKKIFTCIEFRELDYGTIKNNIDHQKPIICGIAPQKKQYFLGAEHLVLLVGYELLNEKPYLIINDPFPYPASENPYLKTSATILKENQYFISLEKFTTELFWCWSLSGLEIK